jgi:hypothetical protein
LEKIHCPLHIVCKGGISMGLMWVTTVGLAICLGIVGGVFIYYLRTALDSEDAHRIDPAPKD